MIKKIFLHSLLLTCTILSIQAKDFKGVVCDAKTKQPLGQALVVSASNAKVSNQVYTDDEGRFMITSAEDDVVLLFKLVGYEDKKLIIEQIGSNVGKVLLTPVVLSEVSVTASTSNHDIDKDTYIITDEIRKGAFNAGEMLGKLPNIMYSFYDTKIRVNGKENVLLLVNGMEKPESYIKDINPKRIKSVEVINNPSGRYLSEDYEAVIDLKLYEDYVGMDLAIGENLMASMDKLDTWNWLFREVPNINFTETRNNVSWNVGYDYEQQRISIYEGTTTIYPERLSSGTVRHDDDEDNIRKRDNNHRVFAGLDYDISKNHQVAAQIKYSNGDGCLDMANDMWYSKQGVTYYDKTQYVYKDDKIDNLVGSLFYNGKLGEQFKIYSDLNYNYYNNKSHTLLSQQDLFNTEIRYLSKKNYLRYNADATYSIGKSSIKFGYSTTWIKAEAKDMLRNIGQSETEDYRNRLFTYYSCKVSPKFSFSLGGAGEWISNESSWGKETHFSFFPDVRLMYKEGNKLDATLQYSSGVTYPSLSQRMQTYRTDSLSMFVANPELKPMDTHNLSARLHFFNCLTLTPSVQFSPNNHQDYFSLMNDGYVSRSFVNSDYRLYSVRLDFYKTLWKRLQVSANVTFGYDRFTYNEYNNSSRNLTGGCTLVYLLNQRTIFLLEYKSVNRKILSLQGYSWGGDNYIMLAARKNFWHDKAQVMLGYMPPIRALEGKSTSGIQTPFYSLERENNQNVLLRNMLMLRVNVRMSHGKRTKKKTYESTVDDEVIIEK
ncbi:MAG: hypothetical protein IKQ72_05820 [Bacteroidaceae bacterium]|nr:hypothetical protein [Bacteroidaceae bacterium]